MSSGRARRRSCSARRAPGSRRSAPSPGSRSRRCLAATSTWIFGSRLPRTGSVIRGSSGGWAFTTDRGHWLAGERSRRRYLVLPALEVVGYVVAELGVDRDHVLVLIGVVGGHVPQLRLMTGQQIQHRDLHQQAKAVSPMQADHCRYLLPAPLRPAWIDVYLSERRNLAAPVLYRGDGVHPRPLGDDALLGGAHSPGVPASRLEIVVMRGIAHGGVGGADAVDEILRRY